MNGNGIIRKLHRTGNNRLPDLAPGLLLAALALPQTFLIQANLTDLTDSESRRASPHHGGQLFPIIADMPTTCYGHDPF